MFFHAQVRNVNCYSVTHESKGVIQGIERVYNCKKTLNHGFVISIEAKNDILKENGFSTIK